jgi:hypothetical protein
MTVAETFGVTADQISDLLETHWVDWTLQAPDLALVPSPGCLCDWLRTADPREADRVLRGLAKLSDADAAASREAGLALAWVMMPAATILAHQLRSMSDDIDFHVAAQLWIAVRTYPWQTTGRVAANLKLNLRKRVVKDLTSTAPYLPLDDSRLAAVESSPDAIEELIELLGDGLDAEVIDQADFDLLMAVLDAADELEPPSGPGIGIVGDRVSERVGQARGCTARTIRRYLKRSIGALGELAEAQKSA